MTSVRSHQSPRNFATPLPKYMNTSVSWKKRTLPAETSVGLVSDLRNHASTDARAAHGVNANPTASIAPSLLTVNAANRSASATYTSSAAKMADDTRVSAPAAVANPEITSSTANVQATPFGSAGM